MSIEQSLIKTLEEENRTIRQTLDMVLRNPSVAEALRDALKAHSSP